MKKVKFSNGTFGIRGMWFFGWSFYDLKSPQFTWRKGSRYFQDCQGTEADVDRVLKVNPLTYKIVKEKENV